MSESVVQVDLVAIRVTYTPSGTRTGTAAARGTVRGTATIQLGERVERRFTGVAAAPDHGRVIRRVEPVVRPGSEAVPRRGAGVATRPWRQW